MKLLASRILALLLCTCVISGARAQEQSADKSAMANTQSVSDALFRIGMLRTDDPAAVEEYIRIHECGLYEQYLNDDIAWTRIREAYGRELQVNLENLPSTLEISSALRMDVYDVATGEFVIEQRSQIDNMGMVNVLDIRDGSYFTCPAIDTSFVPRVHPLGLTVKIDMPVTLNAVPMSRDIADKVIAEMNKRIARDESKRRELTMVIKVTLTGVDPLASVNDPMRRVVLGKIDSLSIYNAPDRKILIYKLDYQSQREKLQKK